MHRSGTSCLAGSLEAAGLILGPVNTKALFNKKGNREHEQIRDLHEEIFKRHRHSWTLPPLQQIAFTSDDQIQLRTHLAELYKGKAWGIKDPRAIYFAEAWKKMTNCRFIGTFRHPLEVANSLISRARVWKQELSKHEALALWRKYNFELIKLYNAHPFPIVRYDVGREIYGKQIIRLSDKIGLDSHAACSFFSDGLTHEKISSDEVPDDCLQIWHALMDAWVDSFDDIASSHLVQYKL